MRNGLVNLPGMTIVHFCLKLQEYFSECAKFQSPQYCRNIAGVLTLLVALDSKSMGSGLELSYF